MANLARQPSLKVNDYAFAFLDASSVSGFGDYLDAFLRHNYHYRPEKDEIVRTPEFMLRDYEAMGYCEGDCDDVASLICALSRCAGFSSRLVAIAGLFENPGGDLDHVFAEIQCSTGWMIIDPTVERGTIYQCTKLVYEPV